MKSEKKKLLLVNSVCGTGSTGHICEAIADEYSMNGWDVRIAYGRKSSGVPNHAEEKYGYRIGSDADVRIHGLITRLYDLHGFGSRRCTEKFIAWAEKYEPDVLWLHNIHGYYVNIKLLFDWIKDIQLRQKRQGKKVMEVKWTLHDCWSFTGHCSYFSYCGCERWKTGCYNCPQKGDYPSSYGLDRSERNWCEKRAIFSGIKKMTIVTPSKWLADLVKKSFLKRYSVEIHYNKINEDVFKPTPSGIRTKYKLKGKKIILGVSNVWHDRKGLWDFVDLSHILDNQEYQIILVGVTQRQATQLKKTTSIIPITRTEDQHQLAEIYSAADFFVNPSREETFGLTTLEAIKCGTEAIVYKDTACEEVINKYGGIAVPVGVDNIAKAITGQSDGSTRKNILFITNIPSPYRVDFFDELGKSCNLTVLFERAGSGERDKSWEDFKFKNFKGVILSGIKIGIDKAICPSIISYLSKNHFDHIVVMDIASPTGLLAIAWMRMKGIEYCFEGDGGIAKTEASFKDKIKAGLKRFAIANAKTCFSTSEFFDKYCITYGAKPENIKRYPFSSIHDSDVIEAPISSDQKRKKREQYGLGSFEHILISVGRIVPIKGFDILLNAADTLDSNWLVLIIGGQPYKDLNQLVSQFESKVNSPTIRFMDFMLHDKLFDYMRMSDAFILPTRYEPWGLVINEAMACGLPIITTLACVAGTELVDESNGWLYDADDVDELKSHLHSLVNMTEDEKYAMGCVSIEIIKNYTIEKMAMAHKRELI